MARSTGIALAILLASPFILTGCGETSGWADTPVVTESPSVSTTSTVLDGSGVSAIDFGPDYPRVLTRCDRGNRLYLMWGGIYRQAVAGSLTVVQRDATCPQPAQSATERS